MKDRLEYVYTMKLATVYPMYVDKVEKKGKTKDELHTVIEWLTGYDEKAVRLAVEGGIDFRTFFEKAPKLNPNRKLITGVICGVRVEDIEEPLMQEIRYLDKVIDELARGKKMQSILRSE